ncbi:putative non-specific serine/threonine protein kinase [Lupinus albus]|uniref:Putative non-specific serine/threonine protein kinase n=1 Tax=Lupinus albus TaxID=3870 RepID=A0A6A4QRZ7_LUPAL|nr:putative non-specific serine/threonine protein kinase [Lupinus albus]
MEEPENKELHTVAHVGDEIIHESMDSEGQVQIKGTFSEEVDGDCNGKDVMVEVLGSDLYIDGVCTSGSGAEFNDELGCSGTIEGDDALDKVMKPAGVGNEVEAQFEGSQAVGSEEVRSDNAGVELDGVALEREESGREDVRSSEFDVASMNREPLFDSRARKEGNTTSGEIEVPTAEDVIVEHVNESDAEVLDHNIANTECDTVEFECMNALDNGILDHKVENIRCDNALESSVTVSSVWRENVQKDGTNVSFETLDEQKSIASMNSGKTSKGEECISDKVEFEKKLNSVGEQPMEINKVVDNSNNMLEAVVGGAEVAVDRALLNSEEKQCFRLEKCIEKEHMTDASQVSSDIGQEWVIEKDGGGVSALNESCGTEVELDNNVSDAEQRSLQEGMEMEADDQPTSERTKIMNHTAEVKVNDACNSVDASTLDREIQVGISKQAGKVRTRSSTKSVSSETVPQASYLLPMEKEGEFSVSDMVWGKVRSHPWWPGQIFDPSDSSDKAMKHCKKDCYLVAYFGDRTFAWNEASQLKPFRKHFSAIEKHSTSESFQNAVECALDEVTKQVEFGLACPCIPKDTYDTIKYQIIENFGIWRELRSRHVMDESLNARTFAPDKLIEYVKSLSVFPTGGFDRLEHVIAKAQLLAFYRFKGYSALPELQYGEGLDNDIDNIIHDGENSLSEVIEHATPVSSNDGLVGPGNLKSQSSSRHKRKRDMKDSLPLPKKERSLSKLMGTTPDSPDGDYWSDEKITDNLVLSARSKKKRTIDHFADDIGMEEGRKTISLAKVSNTTRPSFKIGECIRRVASQLTRSPSLLKSSGRRSQKTDGSTDGVSEYGSDDPFQNFEEAQMSSPTVPTEYSSLDDLLSSLHRVAEDPLGDNGHPNSMVSFFSDFRNTILVADISGKEIFSSVKIGTKRKKAPIAGTPEAFEFEDMSDTYWTDRVVDNGAEEQPPVEKPRRRYKKKDNQLVPAEPGKPVQVSRRPYSRKRNSDSNLAEAPEKPSGYIDENAPAELVMNFAELDSVPSETNLNKMFKRFGPLKESETEVDRVSSRARVVFKKCADAEVACGSAKKFNIFGPVLVTYELNYTPTALFKASSAATTQEQEMHLDLSNFEVNLV